MHEHFERHTEDCRKSYLQLKSTFFSLLNILKAICQGTLTLRGRRKKQYSMPNQIPYELTKGPCYWSHYLGETSLYYGLLLQINAQGQQ